jgi:hypothetical protein
MFQHSRHAGTVLVGALVLLALEGCSVAATNATSSKQTVNTPEVAQRYADCLTAQGIDGVFVGDDGFVGFSVRAGDSGNADGDSGGQDISVGHEDAAFTAATTLCSEQVPEYHQDSGLHDPAQAAQALDEARAFAGCARSNGLTDFPDPDADGALVIPEGTTRAQFLAVVTACKSSFAMTTVGAEGAGDGSMTLSLPLFTGAYDASWADEVANILFDAVSSQAPHE